jgi:murein DD-endopeptidase MepM/ murein hydrolase activator NlpD
MKAPIDGYKHATYPHGSVTQWFGENYALYNKNVCYDYCLAGHNGIDIVAPWGSRMYAVKSGIVWDVKHSPTGYGKHFRILHDRNDGFIEEWVYGHCSEIYVKDLQRVEEGQFTSLMGNTGFVVSGSTPYWKHNPYAGTHLHLGVRLWKKWDGTGQFTYQVGDLKLVAIHDYNNGYFGAYDFSKELGEAVGAIDTPQQTALRMTLKSLQNELGKLVTRKRSF